MTPEMLNVTFEYIGERKIFRYARRKDSRLSVFPEICTPVGDGSIALTCTLA